MTKLVSITALVGMKRVLVQNVHRDDGYDAADRARLRWKKVKIEEFIPGRIPYFSMGDSNASQRDRPRVVRRLPKKGGKLCKEEVRSPRRIRGG